MASLWRTRMRHLFEKQCHCWLVPRKDTFSCSFKPFLKDFVRKATSLKIDRPTNASPSASSDIFMKNMADRFINWKNCSIGET